MCLLYSWGIGGRYIYNIIRQRFQQPSADAGKTNSCNFGRFAGMVTVFITSTNPDQPFPHADIDFKFPSLESFAQALES